MIRSRIQINFSLSVCLSVRLCVCPSLCLSVSLPICLSVYLSVCRQDISKSIPPTFMKVCGRVDHRPIHWLNVVENWMKISNNVCKNFFVSVYKKLMNKKLIAQIIQILCKSLIFTNKLNLQETINLSIALFIQKCGHGPRDNISHVIFSLMYI